MRSFTGSAELIEVIAPVEPFESIESTEVADCIEIIAMSRRASSLFGGTILSMLSSLQPESFDSWRISEIIDFPQASASERVAPVSPALACAPSARFIAKHNDSGK
jgi:hypothetical protein